MSNSMNFDSRRSVVIAPRGAVSCAQPLAAQIGIDILKQGGNAADAAVAVAAALNVTQPCSTGIGGDAFCLFFDAKERQVKALNGSGRCPELLTLERLNSEGYGTEKPLPIHHGHTVTVPGAAAAFVDTVQFFGSGKLTLSELLAPVIDLAENGFPVSQTTAHFWKKGEAPFFDKRNPGGDTFLLNGRSPKWGEHFRNPDLADTYRELAARGRKGFYEGRVAEAIVKAVAAFGGVMSLEDLQRHASTFEDPISTSYKGVEIWEIPPNGIGIVALIALNILSLFDLKALGHNTPEYLHTVMEAIRLAFSDVMSYGADPVASEVPISGMLSMDYAKDRMKLIKDKRAMSVTEPGNPWLYNPGSDTVYLTVTDVHGNACSFIVSNYMGFGSGIVPQNCGFTLQNRGLNFSLEKDHPNVIAPKKRPLHTIIPAMVTDSKTGLLLCSYGVMGGFMQPQGHVQVLLNMLEFGMNPQQALDALRFCIGSGHGGPFGSVSLEEGFDIRVLETLRHWGHDIIGPISGHARAIFGRGHVISKGAWFAINSEEIADDPKCWWAGSDPRADGQAVGY